MLTHLSIEEVMQKSPQFCFGLAPFLTSYRAVLEPCIVVFDRNLVISNYSQGPFQKILHIISVMLAKTQLFHRHQGEKGRKGSGARGG